MFGLYREHSVVFGTVLFPITKAHPAELMLAMIALHVVTAPVLFNTNVTLGTVFGVRGNVVGRFAVVSTLGEPLLDDDTVRGGVILDTTLEAEAGRTAATSGSLGFALSRSHHYTTVGPGAEAQGGVS
uniref:Uncharacterized protein n=1 Tax=Cacopsylla melanoneura TaxID=428564 RepID=A0A8D8T8B4_9HEMI